MRIDEIIAARTTRVRMPDKAASYMPKGSDATYAKELGNGQFSNVYKLPDPHMVTKRSAEAMELEQDPYYLYVKEIVDKNLASENPYYPRIYSIVILDNPVGGNDDPNGSLYHVRMETLYEMTTLNDEEAWGLFNKIVDTKEWGDVRNKTTGAVPRALTSIGEILSSIHWFLEMNNTNQFRDEDMLDALRMIKAIKNRNGNFAFDNGINNIMIRRTSVGPQLVLTDLLFNRKYV